MISFRKRPAHKGGLVCLGFHSDGLSFVHLDAIECARPRLVHCGQWVGSRADAGRELVHEMRAHGLAGAPCVAVLSPDRYSLRLVEAPDVEPEEFASSIRWLIKDLIDFPVEDAVVDFFDIPQQQRVDRARRIYVVAAQTDVVQEVVDLSARSDLRLQSIDVSELALLKLGSRIAGGPQGVALVQVGRRGGLVAMIEAGCLRLVRRLEAGLMDLRPSLPAFEPEREPLLADALEAQVSEPGAEPALAHEAEGYDALLLELQRSLDYYESQLGHTAISKLLFAPLEESVPDLMPFLEKNLTVEVQTFGLRQLLEMHESLSPVLEARCLGAVGAGLGFPASIA